MDDSVSQGDNGWPQDAAAKMHASCGLCGCSPSSLVRSTPLKHSIALMGSEIGKVVCWIRRAAGADGVTRVMLCLHSFPRESSLWCSHSLIHPPIHHPIACLGPHPSHALPLGVAAHRGPALFGRCWSPVKWVFVYLFSAMCTDEGCRPALPLLRGSCQDIASGMAPCFLKILSSKVRGQSRWSACLDNFCWYPRAPSADLLVTIACIMVKMRLFNLHHLLAARHGHDTWLFHVLTSSAESALFPCIR